MLAPNDPGQKGRGRGEGGDRSWRLGEKVVRAGQCAGAGTCPGEKDGQGAGVSCLSAGHNQEGEVQAFQGS